MDPVDSRPYVFAAWRNRDASSKWHLATVSTSDSGHQSWISLCGFGGSVSLADIWQGQTLSELVCKLCLRKACESDSATSSVRQCVKCHRTMFPMSDSELVPATVAPDGTVGFRMFLCSECQGDK